MAGKPATLRLNIVANARQAKDALRDTERTAGRFAGKMRSVATGLGVVFAAVGAGAVQAVKAAADEEQQAAQLARVLQNVTGATNAQVAATERWIDAAKIGSIQSDDTIRPALARLATVTGDLTTAQDLLKISMDVAAGTGKELAPVSVAVAKAYGGNTAALARLIPGLDTSNIKAGDSVSIQKQLAEKYKGADKAASDTAKGGLQDFSDVTGDIAEELGTALLPTLQDFTDWATSKEGQEGIQASADAAKALGDAIQTLVGFTDDVARFIDKVRELNDAFEKFTTGREFRNPDWWPGNWGRSASAYGVTTRAGIAPAAYGVGGATPFGINRAGMTMPGRVAATPVVINVSGALDPVAVAAQIRRLLADDARRRGQ